jgi:predicted permease
MTQFPIVLLKIAVMFLVMLTGWWMARRRFLSVEGAKGLGVIVVEVAFPCLIFTQMMATVSVATLKRGWWVPLLAVVSVMLAAAVGRLLLRWGGAESASRRTFVFLVAVPNWAFLPLPIVEGLYGAEGVRVVLLFNLGAQGVLWTFGVWVLKGGVGRWGALRNVLGNPGIVATLGGAAVALALPGLAGVSAGPTDRGWGMVGKAVMEALTMVGSLTIPLSLLATGAQLGDLTQGMRAQWRVLAGVALGRLVVAPLLILALLKAFLVAFGIVLPEAEFMTLAIILAMPVAISCSMFAERFEGDTGLSAGAIFWTTLLSLASVPLMALLCRRYGL